MFVVTNQDAGLLLPNAEHKNFTRSDNYIPNGTELEGEFVNIKGKRRGQDFTYRLFKTDRGNLMFAEKVNPIKTEKMTEVNLGADGKQSTTITMPNASKYDKAHVIGAIAGTIIGFVVAKKMKKTRKQTLIIAAASGVAGFVGGKMIAGKPVIDVKISS